jgi:hypothetical protein
MNPARKAFWFIESRLAGELTLDAVAAIAGISRFHMVRAFAEKPAAACNPACGLCVAISSFAIGGYFAITSRKRMVARAGSSLESALQTKKAGEDS